MRRNKFLAKSLSVGLAVATAAAIICAPMVLMTPVTVCAAGDTSNETPAVSFEDAAKTAVGDVLTVKLAETSAGMGYKWYAVDANTSADVSETNISKDLISEKGSLFVSKDYVGKKILVIVKTSEEGGDEIGRALSDVITYAALPEDSVVKFGEETMASAEDKSYNDDITVTAQTKDSGDYYIADSADGFSGEQTEYVFEKGTQDGEITKTLYFKTADDDTIYQKDITIDFLRYH